MRLWLFVFILLIGLPVRAFDFEGAQTAYDRGHFAKAAEMARALDSADGYALAARAELVVAAYLEQDRKQARKSLDQALIDARAAVAVDPNHVEGQLQTAIATGYIARIERSPSLARDAKALVDNVLKGQADHSYALATLGGWHGETVATIGGFLAALTTGASKGEFMDAFEAALKADPVNPAIRTYYARILLDIGGKKRRQRAAEVLKEALELPPRDAFENMLQDHAKMLHMAYEKGEKDALKAVVKRLTPFSDKS